MDKSSSRHHCDDDLHVYNYSYYPGPKKGIVSAQRAFETGIFSNPLINKDGETILLLKDSIIALNKKLETIWEQSIQTPRTLALLKKGRYLVGCANNLIYIDNKKITKAIPMPDTFSKDSLTPFTCIIEGPRNRLYFLTGDAVFCLDENLGHIWSENLAQRFGLFGGWRLTVNSSNQAFISGAFSWTGGDDSIEYAGYLGSISSNGEFLWQKNYHVDNLPTSTGLSLRLAITSNGVWLSERGAVSYDFDGNEVWRTDDEEGTTQLFAVTPDDRVIYAEKQDLINVSERDNFSRKPLLTLNGWPHEVCLDCNNNVYALGTEGLEAWSEKEDILFKIEGIIGENISLGENTLLVSSRRGRISLIE